MPAIDNAFYDDLHQDWWADGSFMALLRNAINPPRFAWFREVLAQQGRTPAGLALLDVGCGGGILAESFATLGCAVTGVDRSAPTLEAARAHARAAGLDIHYVDAPGESLPFPDASFDLVCCCDVLEHVDDIDVVMAEIRRVLKPGGLFFFDTINRTFRSWLVTIKMAQDWPPTRLMPRNVHVWDMYIRPDELEASLQRHGLASREMVGLSPAGNPLAMLAALVRHKRGRLDFAGLGEQLRFGVSRDLSISYMGFAQKRGAGGPHE